MTIAIVDYGMGNLRSVSKALEALGASVRVSSDPLEVERADKVILPGVGAFGAAMRELSSRRLIEPITSAIAKGTPYLGICLGLQLLFETSDEGAAAGQPRASGLGVLPGAVKQFPLDMEADRPASGGEALPLKVPHMGWNQATGMRPSSGGAPSGCPLLQGIPEASFFYFVHSYYAEPTDLSVIALQAEYGLWFTAMVWRKNLFATQFHPEKSQAVGLRLLKNFVEL